MPDIEPYSQTDRRGLEQLYRRTYGHEAVDRLRFLWDWARRNPAAGNVPPFWVVRDVGRLRPILEEVQSIRRFDAGVDGLWERVRGSLSLAVRRDARYLNWKFMEPPHVRYHAAVLRRGEEVAGYVIYRHFREPQGRVTQIVDFLADPSDDRAVATLAGWVDREARLEDSDKIRCYASHAEFRRHFRRNGFFVVKTEVEVAVKVNAPEVPKDFYQSGDAWHLTLGDGALDH